ncbi:DUF4148 domain-containing protein [Paraburkholderia xenovorans]|uniref:DUF4148 domain-containing protein n=1 Tax=Paraburkholderia xenovorans (strain LB400) TaxID=266265 RepID=Q13JA1_PARXL|nr:Conserved hypothetical protein [Paraburkholderia xenovorans LB400]
MRIFIRAVTLSSIFAFPFLVHAQSDNVPLTRAEVRADLLNVERAGYMSRWTEPNYPVDIQQAEAKIAADKAASVPAVSSRRSPDGH